MTGKEELERLLGAIGIGEAPVLGPPGKEELVVSEPRVRHEVEVVERAAGPFQGEGAEPERGSGNGGVTRQVEVLQVVAGSQVGALQENTRALLTGTGAAQAETSEKKSSGIASAIGKTLLNVVTLSPLISGLASLFGGKKKEPEVPLVKYERPARQEYEFGATAGVVAPVRYEGSVARADEALQRVYAPVVERPAVSVRPEGAGPQVVVQVDAMDAESFLERSDLVASAVKRALLESHSLADVMGEI